MNWNGESLSGLDRQWYNVLEAIKYGGIAPTSTHARPTTFVCIDGKTYWIKNRAQQGLVAELVAGRLGAKAGAGPAARIIRVTKEALPSSGEADHLEGVVVSIEDIPRTVNSKDLAKFIGSGQFEPGVLSPSSRARVIAFQSWLGIGDAQALVGMTDGGLYSIDHGECFGNVDNLIDPSIIIAQIPGVDSEFGRSAEAVMPAVGRI